MRDNNCYVLRNGRIFFQLLHRVPKFEGVFKVEETDFPELYKIKSQRALNLVEIIFLVLFITLLALAMIRFILFIASVLGPSFLSSEDNKTTSSKSKS